MHGYNLGCEGVDFKLIKIPKRQKAKYARGLLDGKHYNLWYKFIKSEKFKYEDKILAGINVRRKTSCNNVLAYRNALMAKKYYLADYFANKIYPSNKTLNIIVGCCDSLSALLHVSCIFPYFKPNIQYMISPNLIEELRVGEFYAPKKIKFLSLTKFRRWLLLSIHTHNLTNDNTEIQSLMMKLKEKNFTEEYTLMQKYGFTMQL
jgi:hypothetical protein